jgi:hypothetical protein
VENGVFFQSDLFFGGGSDHAYDPKEDQEADDTKNEQADDDGQHISKKLHKCYNLYGRN